MQTVSFAGSSYNIPNTRGDRPWSGLSDFIVAAASKAINTAGGNFTLLADINFGATFGLVSTYYKSRTANVASAGQIRLANTDTIKFRNTLNDGDLTIDINSNNLRFAATKILLSGAVVNADINASAAIAYSKLALTGAILNADLAGSIAYSKLVLTGSVVNADIGASAAIAYSKLALTGSIVNGDVTAGTLTNAAINASAAIALTKLAALASHSRALVSDGSGFITEATTTATEIGYVNGVTSAIQTQMDLKAPKANPTFTGTVTIPDGTTSATAAAFGQLKYFQTVAATTTTSTSTSSATYQVTNISAAITPSSASHRVKVTVSGCYDFNGSTGDGYITIARGGTNLIGANGFVNAEGIHRGGFAFSYIDSPASTSALTYAVYCKGDATKTIVVCPNSTTGSIVLEEIV